MDGTAVQTGFPAGLSRRTARYFLLRKRSLVFALRASLRLFKFVPNDKCVAKRPVCREQTGSHAMRPKGSRQDWRETAYPKKRPPGSRDLWRYSVPLRMQALGKPSVVCPFAFRLTPCASRLPGGVGSAKGQSFDLCHRASLFATLSCVASKVQGLPSMVNPLSASASPLKRPVGPIRPQAAMRSAAEREQPRAKSENSGSVSVPQGGGTLDRGRLGEFQLEWPYHLNALWQREPSLRERCRIFRGRSPQGVCFARQID